MTKCQQAVAGDVVIQRGQVCFGVKQIGDMAIVLPQFDIRKGCSIGTVRKVVNRINATQRLRQDGYAETLLRKEMGTTDTRILMQDGNLVPLDQEAATTLRQMKFPMKKERHYIPIK